MTGKLSKASLQRGELSSLLGYQLARASVATNQCFDTAVKQPLGLGKVEFTLLYLIKHNPAIGPSRLAREIAFTMPATTAWLTKLEQRGWVRKERNDADRRAQHLYVTPEGDGVTEQAITALKLADVAVLSPLSTAEQAMLLELLRKLAYRGHGTKGKVVREDV